MMAALPESIPVGRECLERVALRQVGASTFVLTPPDDLDRETRAAMTEAVAALAVARPKVVVDLTNVVAPDETAIRLLLQLAALARGAGGRLLAAWPRAGSEWLELHEVDAGAASSRESLAEWVGR